jgi:hypothetical protein
MIQQLTLDLLRSELTAEQEEERIEQTRLALEEKRRQETELEEKSSLFFGSSDFILEQIQRARRTKRWITPAELRSYIADFFQNYYIGTRISWDKPEEGFVIVSLSNDARFDLSSFCRQHREMRSLLLQSGSEPVVLGYTNEAIKMRQDIEFLSHFHPLVRWITSVYQDEKNPFFRASAIEVKSPVVEPGDYLFIIELWKFIAQEEELQIAYALTPLGGCPVTDPAIAELLLQDILACGQNWAYADQMVNGEKIRMALQTCNNNFAEQREEAFEIFQRKTIASTQRKIAHLKNHLARKEESFKKSLERLQYRINLEGSTEEQRIKIERLIKGDHTKLENVRQKIAVELQELNKAGRSRAEFEEIAGGVCRVVR